MYYDQIQTIIELQSIAWTFPLVILSAYIIYECSHSLRHAIRRTDDKITPQMGWIICGITIGFLGNAVDNLYWLIPWTSHYLEMPFTTNLIEFGVFPNIIFRQLMTTIAAYCHIRAFIAPTLGASRKTRRITKICLLSIAFGQLYSVIVWLIKAELL